MNPCILLVKWIGCQICLCLRGIAQHKHRLTVLFNGGLGAYLWIMSIPHVYIVSLLKSLNQQKNKLLHDTKYQFKEHHS
jgi:hypothetical protein